MDTSVAMSRALDRLRLGLHPTTEELLGIPRPFSFSLPLVASGALTQDSESESEVPFF